MNTTSLNRNIFRFVIAWLLASIAAYFVVSFLSNVSSNFIFFSLTIPGLFMFVILIINNATSEKIDWLNFFVLTPALGLTVAALWLCSSFPTLFIHSALFMEDTSLPAFAGLAVVSDLLAAGLWSAWTRRGVTERLRAHRIVRFIADHQIGFILAGLFLLTYLALAETINFPGHRTLDQYYDLDISAWLARLTADSPADITDAIRAVHPAVMLFLRPLVGLASLLLNGDRMQATFLVHALTAAACVFLTWRIVLRISGNKSYATVFATLLGATASHLLLGSMLETYIYSAFALLLFIEVLQMQVVDETFGQTSAETKSRAEQARTVLAGILVFGITVTNIVQTGILYFFQSPRQIKRIVIYGILVVASVFLLNLLQVTVYPAADPLTPEQLLGEKNYNSGIESSWKLRGRTILTTRSIVMYAIVAPTPYILTEELGMTAPNFRTFEITVGEFHVAGYSGLADVTAKLWLLILAAALGFFAWRWLKESPRPLFTLGLLACVGFNFALHLVYGDDPMLYSPDWVYALVLFMAFTFAPLANRKWIQLALIGFLVLMIFVNVGLLAQIMSVSAPVYGR
ncbi:MAG: hypothetical protein HFACDABA_00522 [Anaerolineales bacterium]|nr:hypothetical protein [Anaerolineales bacterium]